ncbi:MAG: TolB family protein, partial [Flavobacteriales bacterium]
DFFVSVKTDEEWDQAMPLRGINTERNEGAPSLSADGQLLIFTACESVDGWGKYQGKGSCDLFFSQRSGQDWSPAQNLGKVNSYKWESQPSFSADGRTLYFVRGVRGPEGVNSQDIFFAQLQKDGSWSTPAKIPGFVNTEMEEESVMIHPDGETLYFASNGHPGMGGMDLFVSRKQKDGQWGTPMNLGYPINTGGDENSILVTSEGDVALFASDRPGGFGDLDLYSFDLPANVMASSVTYVKGTVLDATSFRRLEAKFELIDLATGELVVESYSNPGDGSFLVCLPPNREYVLNVTKPGYLFYSDSFKLKSKGNNEPYELEVLLQKIKDGSSIVLKNVFFDTDKFDLRSES